MNKKQILAIQEKWNVLSDFEKNKIIAREVLNFTDDDIRKAFEEEENCCIPDYLNWEGFGIIVEKINKEMGLFVGLKTYPAGIYLINTGSYDFPSIELQSKDPWDAIVVAYLLMKGIEI